MNEVSDVKEVGVGVLGRKVSLTVVYDGEGKFFTTRLTPEEADSLADQLKRAAAQLADK